MRLLLDLLALIRALAADRARLALENLVLRRPLPPPHQHADAEGEEGEGRGFGDVVAIAAAATAAAVLGASTRGTSVRLRGSKRISPSRTLFGVPFSNTSVQAR